MNESGCVLVINDQKNPNSLRSPQALGYLQFSLLLSHLHSQYQSVLLFKLQPEAELGIVFYCIYLFF